MAGRELTDRALVETMLDMLGPTRAAVVLGWCVMCAFTAPGDADRAWLLKHGPMSQATRYRMVGHLVRIRDRLAELGYDTTPATGPAVAPIRSVMGRVAA